MKNSILMFLLGVFVTISIAATTTDFMTVKPAKPVSVIVNEGSSMRSYDEWIIKNSQNGYVLKSLSQNPNYTIIVMEKY